MKKTVLLLGLAAVISAAASTSAKAQVIVDNTSKGFSASTNWLTGSFGGYGGSFRYRSTAPVSDSATWAVSLPAGTYAISAWWVAGANRTASAPYIVYHSGGTTTVLRNQQVGGGQWNLLGTFSLNAGVNQVKLSPWTATGYVIIADAIRWQ